MAFVTTPQGISYMLHGQMMGIPAGQILDTEDPDDAAIIRQNPSAWVPVTSTRGNVHVEQATAAPGEERNVRRPR
jgi:hypothetical protein